MIRRLEQRDDRLITTILLGQEAQRQLTGFEDACIQAPASFPPARLAFIIAVASWSPESQNHHRL